VTTEAELAAKQAAATQERNVLAYTSESNTKLQSLTITEQGANPIKVVLRGGTMPVTGAGFPVQSRGGVYVPMFAASGYSAVTGLLFGETEMEFSWEVPFFTPADFAVTGTDYPNTPEQLAAVFQQIQNRGRPCTVQIGSFSRIGILRECTPKPGRGYTLDPSGTNNRQITPGTNLEVSMRWEWSGEGLPGAPSDVVPDVVDVRKMLNRAVSTLSSALSDEDPFAPDFLEGLKDTLGKLNSAVSSLRKSISKIASFASAPAKLANEAIAGARVVGGLANDLDRALGDIATEYQTANAGAAALLGMRRAKGQAKQALTDVMSAVVDCIKALEKRKTRTVGVHPGVLLSDVAARELGNADRWQEIADLNGITGKKVPPGTFAVEVKG